MENQKVECNRSACEFHTCANNTCILEKYGKFLYIDTYGHKLKFRSIGCLKYHIKILKWKIGM